MLFLTVEWIMIWDSGFLNGSLISTTLLELQIKIHDIYFILAVWKICTFVIKVRFDNVDLMTFTEEGMIMKSTASSIYMECCHIEKWWENKQNVDKMLWIYTAKWTASFWKKLLLRNKAEKKGWKHRQNQNFMCFLPCSTVCRRKAKQKGMKKNQTVQLINSYWLTKLELLSLLTKIPICEIFAVICIIHNFYNLLLAFLPWRKTCKQTPSKSQVKKNADLVCNPIRNLTSAFTGI